MQFKDNTKQRSKTIQGLRSFKDTLPTSIKNECIKQLTKQTQDYYNDLHGMELNQMLRLIEYLKEVESPHEGADNVDKLQSDFKNFYSQYDKRRGKDFANTFGNKMVTWYEQL